LQELDKQDGEFDLGGIDDDLQPKSHKQHLKTYIMEQDVDASNSAETENESDLTADNDQTEDALIVSKEK